MCASGYYQVSTAPVAAGQHYYWPGPATAVSRESHCRVSYRAGAAVTRSELSTHTHFNKSCRRATGSAQTFMCIVYAATVPVPATFLTKSQPKQECAWPGQSGTSWRPALSRNCSLRALQSPRICSCCLPDDLAGTSLEGIMLACRQCRARGYRMRCSWSSG